jgi:SHS2 domain-containing protein
VRPSERGHRLAPHTADTIIEAWGPTVEDCLAEAVAALVSCFAELPPTPARRSASVSVSATTPEDLLVAVLEEVVFRLDVDGTIPVDATFVVRREDDGWRATGTFQVCDAARADATGAVPKAVARSDLEFGERDGGWVARATVDV